MTIVHYQLISCISCHHSRISPTSSLTLSHIPSTQPACVAVVALFCVVVVLRVCVCVSVCLCLSLCVCVCVCVREREMERVKLLTVYAMSLRCNIYFMICVTLTFREKNVINTFWYFCLYIYTERERERERGI